MTMIMRESDRQRNKERKKERKKEREEREIDNGKNPERKCKRYDEE